ncbi:hypothetical protein NQ015_08345 [Corynebacterium sp. 153RC1]|nr:MULTISPECIES: hypothetical protein [unclassified Corynebacterium]MCQ9357252.1 hypothetical protein [Corynebacterium sp. 122RC1]MCQ9370822.1 hypothetical protein [Corynebacterium sp. 35RC1]MCQ9353505.1 hypothetical protein [Corynebacterium sp. 209RC1]MCQ9355127.1 hypothetical protein [Corynebacterium sp. 1222RC1]MCQ9359427.1 hypothetical protein [Corynebacterium sp. 142RC1]
MRLEVLGNVGGHLSYVVRGLDEHLNAGCLFEEFHAVRFGELVFPHQLLKRDIDSVLIEVNFRQARLKVQLQHCTVALGGGTHAPGCAARHDRVPPPERTSKAGAHPGDD